MAHEFFHVLALFFFVFKQAQGVILQGAVAGDAVQSHSGVHSAQTSCRPCGRGRMAFKAGLGAPIGQVVCVPAVDGRRKIGNARLSLGPQDRVGVAALAEHGLPRLCFFKQIGLIYAVVDF